ncbi:5-oxoprolinase [Acrocarpospora pleiomorpha]|uniref:5-oxoprolinase n=1 Tax=Acrocarpospora pleiomorpha TaxID=90975 RepID=A0A5M3XAW8_9ACTN|nr:hydantoinase/oxoprolinase family protein [Acrocarpospora pleiomorpha]GES17349.1 5-oxoprolinase [Acrocarpospora pleiomorpha]
MDIGGTFTDAVLIEESTGKTINLKVPSSRSAPWKPVLEVIDRLAGEHGVQPHEITYFVHGTTLATNTLIERNGARTGLLVTRGFRDLMELGRVRMDDLLDFAIEAQLPLVSRNDVVEIDERILADGTVDIPLKPAQVRDAGRALVDDGAEALAVCFLHSYRYPAHEQAAGAELRMDLEDFYVAVSSEIWPELSEYERGIVAVIEAYVGKRMAAYFRDLTAGLRDKGVTANMLVTRSNGGVMTAETAASSAAETLLSGPASGVVGASYSGHVAGVAKIVAFDMGGTSAEVSVIDGDPVLSNESRVGGFPAVMPAVDVDSVGAGGGSIAWIDAGGVLKVGPRSAGSEPGPVCLGRGGTEVTVTDAYVELGIIDPDRFLGGELKLRRDLSHVALEALGARLGVSAVDAADAIVQVATTNMYAGLVPLAAKKGIELADFAMLPYGGAGPTHACMLAEETGIRRVVVPPAPGTLCALGALTTDIKTHYVRSVYDKLEDVRREDMVEAVRTMETEARAWLSGQNLETTGVEVQSSADIRYVGQGFYLNVPWPAGDGPADLTALQEAFHQRHERLFRYSDPASPIEILAVRLQIVGTIARPPAPARPLAREHHDRVQRTRKVYSKGEYLDASVHAREDLRPGELLPGPCVVEQYDTTTYVTAAYEATVDDAFNLVITEKGSK